MGDKIVLYCKGWGTFDNILDILYTKQYEWMNKDMVSIGKYPTFWYSHIIIDERYRLIDVFILDAGENQRKKGSIDGEKWIKREKNKLRKIKLNQIYGNK